MRIVVQRVKSACVRVNNKVVGKVERGLCLLVCIERPDDSDTVVKAARKIAALRIFEDSRSKMALNLHQAAGSVLSVSQFTLSWRGVKGNRPSFDQSAAPETARTLFDQFNEELCNQNVPVETGSFGELMEVEVINDGPVTFVLDF